MNVGLNGLLMFQSVLDIYLPVKINRSLWVVGVGVFFVKFSMPEQIFVVVVSHALKLVILVLV